MSNVGAYTEIPPGHEVPDWNEWDNYHSGDLASKGSWGLTAEWYMGYTPPEGSQVYLIWHPEVIAVWNDEEEIEDGEDGEHEDDALTGPGDEEVAPELDEGSGSTGPLEVGGDEGSVGSEEAE